VTTTVSPSQKSVNEKRGDGQDFGKRFARLNKAFLTALHDPGRLYGHVYTLGHTPGHQSLHLTLGSGQQVVLAGDACYLRETLQHRRLPKVLWDKQQALQALTTLHHLQQRPDTLFIPGHDPVVWPDLRQAPAYYD
jgi:glyoxylase-like metal-dependent hydrolase (beta-lactamase superfamily II)